MGCKCLHFQKFSIFWYLSLNYPTSVVTSTHVSQLQAPTSFSGWYRMTYQSQTSFRPLTLTLSSTKRQHTIQNLQFGANYSIQMRSEFSYRGSYGGSCGYAPSLSGEYSDPIYAVTGESGIRSIVSIQWSRSSQCDWWGLVHFGHASFLCVCLATSFKWQNKCIQNSMQNPTQFIWSCISSIN